MRHLSSQGLRLHFKDDIIPCVFFPSYESVSYSSWRSLRTDIDYFARINKDTEGGRVQDFAKKLGFKDVDEMADAIHELKQKWD